MLIEDDGGTDYWRHGRLFVQVEPCFQQSGGYHNLMYLPIASRPVIRLLAVDANDASLLILRTVMSAL